MDFRDSSMIWTLHPFRWRMEDMHGPRVQDQDHTATERPYLSLCSSPIPNPPSGLFTPPRGAMVQLAQI